MSAPELSGSPPGPSRREFAAAAVATAVTPLAAPAAEADQGKSPRLGAADGLSAVVRARYGNYLTAEQLREVRKEIARNQVLAERMRQYKLTNGDEPAFTFHADLP
jgi:hypothetical protein